MLQRVADVVGAAVVGNSIGVHSRGASKQASILLAAPLTVIDLGHEDARSSMVRLKVDFDLQFMLMARRIGKEYERAPPKTSFRDLLDLPAKVEVESERVRVTVDKRAHNPYLVAADLADKPAAMPWFGDKQLHSRFA